MPGGSRYLTAAAHQPLQPPSVARNKYVDVEKGAHRVILGAHNGFRVPWHRVVDVSGPHSRESEHGDVREVVAGHDKEANDVRACLPHRGKSARSTDESDLGLKQDFLR